MNNRQMRIAIARAQGWRSAGILANFWYQMISPYTGKICNIPDYLNDITAAMELVESNKDKFEWFDIYLFADLWVCIIDQKFRAQATTIARAICYAFTAWERSRNG